MHTTPVHLDRNDSLFGLAITGSAGKANTPWFESASAHLSFH